MDRFIDKQPLFLSSETSIHHAIQKMIDLGKCNLLVYDKDQNVVGIVTERDILRKIAILAIDDKLSYNISTIMTRPVVFIEESNVVAQVKRVFHSKKNRHFPIINRLGNSSVDDVQGMLTVTDFFKKYIDTF